MTEEMKIEAFLKEYQALFDNTLMDVCKSRKGRWFFYKLDSESGEYECFVEFRTVQDLIDLILGEIAFEMRVSVDLECEPPKYKYEDLAQFL